MSGTLQHTQPNVQTSDTDCRNCQAQTDLRARHWAHICLPQATPRRDPVVQELQQGDIPTPHKLKASYCTPLQPSPYQFMRPTLLFRLQLPTHVPV